MPFVVTIQFKSINILTNDNWMNNLEVGISSSNGIWLMTSNLQFRVICLTPIT